MKCIKCGYDNLDGLQYCSHCNAELITREEKAKRLAEGEQSNNKLLKIIIGLVVVLALVVVAIFVVPMLMNKVQEMGSDNDTPAISDSVDQDTPGEWHCTNDPNDQDTYTVTILLQTDGTFKIGPYDNLEENRFEGTYISKSYDATDESGQYNLYQVVMTKDVTVENGETTEDEETKVNTYSLGIDAGDSNRGIFTDGESGSTYYCTR